MIIVTKTDLINRQNTMYSLDAFFMKGNASFHASRIATLYGYVEGVLLVKDGDRDFRIINRGFFCLPLRDAISDTVQFDTSRLDTAMVIARYGFMGQEVFGTPVAGHGRLTYIDGCSDSLLVYPPRQGDPSLNHLHFPQMIKQTRHVHPSIRVGYVLGGEGIAHFGNHKARLKKGMMFLLDAQEKHSFETQEEELDIIAFHPDGDWGPTDHSHTMLNRTYK